MNATAVAAALGARAEEVCRRYLPHGRRQGRYWVAGDLDGARGRSLFVRLTGPGTPGKFTDAATGVSARTVFDGGVFGLFDGRFAARDCGESPSITDAAPASRSSPWRRAGAAFSPWDR